MNLEMTDLERRLVEVAVAGAPKLTEEQITDLRRVFKPGVAGSIALLPQRPSSTRRAA